MPRRVSGYFSTKPRNSASVPARCSSLSLIHIFSIQVTGVDIEPIVRGPAASSDNPGNRRRRVREMLFEQLGVTDSNDLFATYSVLWRGTKREVEVLFENVRELSDEKLRGRPGTWTVVIDFPFDDPRFSPADDLARLAGYRGDDTRTLVWMPSFFSAKAQHDLGRLVVLDYILTGERFNELAAHLALVDRGPAPVSYTHLDVYKRQR